jgi:hypothetical protein
VTADRDCVASAYFHYTTPGHKSYDAKRFQSLAAIDDKAPHTDGSLIPHTERLWFLAEPAGADGKRGEPKLCVLDKDVVIRPADKSPAAEEASALLTKLHDYTYGFTIGHDDASVVVKAKGKTYRLPKGDKAYDAAPWSRRIREVVTERYLLNAHGTFYEVPREDFAGIRPVATHNRWIADFCTWRGLLVMSGALAAAKPDGNYFVSPDGPGIWLGGVDDLWQLGKPHGQGGPWLKTPVKAGQPSDPYLMTGFERKSIELSHNAASEVVFSVEVDFLNRGVWREYESLAVPAGQVVRHEFPAGYSAHWLRVTASKECAATAWLVYE